jgi:hypothetical protein
MTELPVQPTLGGMIWTWIVPALVFAVALVATALLYRHFSRNADGDGA